MPASGQPENVGGFWRGATDFSEFSVASGLPAGLTSEEEDAINTVYSIGNDPAEGNYLQVDISAFDDYFWVGIDSFDGLIADRDNDNLEILARIELTSNDTGNRSWAAPGIYLSGTAGAEFDGIAGRVGARTTSDWEIYITQTQNGSGGIIGSSSTDVPYTETVPKWVWIRLRILDQGATDDWFIKTWEGTLDDEPGGWQVTDTGLNKRAVILTGDRIGFSGIGAFLMPGATHRMSFFSFATNVPTLLPPEPDEVVSIGDIIPPTVTMETIQGDWASARINPPTVQT